MLRNTLIASLLFLLMLGFESPSSAADQWQNVARIVALGDVHGDYRNFIEILRDADVIDRRGNWIGGSTHFVQLGDLPDRGPDTDKIVEHMKKLERQAQKAGGMVHALTGNHEAMNMLGDLRYVHPNEYAALKGGRTTRLRETFYESEIRRLKELDPEFVADLEFRKQWLEQIPLGYVEHRLAWSNQGEFGSWVATHNSVIKINRLLFLHGGISSEVLGMSITEINEQVRTELAGNLSEAAGLSERETGPLWYRGLATNDEQTEQILVDNILAFYDVDHIVIGHTPGLGTIVPRFGGKVLVIDSGISDFYGAHLASLLIEGEESINIQRGKALPIPLGNESLLGYYKSVTELEPTARALQQLITTMEAEL